MDASSTVWIIAVIALVTGALIGYLSGRAGGNSSKEQELNKQLDETQRELADYKEKVTTHFAETADLVSGLTESYRAVHQHLAKSSVELCDSEQVSRSLEAAIQPRLVNNNETGAEETGEEKAENPVEEKQTQNADQDKSMAAPLDYAPKKPDEEGTLSETFGLKEGEEAVQEAPKDPADFAEPKDSKTDEASKPA
ncbi:MAG: YhcB family protein [Pontibacterium sp.]